MSEWGAGTFLWAAPFSDILAPLWKKRLFWGGKTQKKSAKKNLRLLDIHKMYILQKNWTKTVNPALSSGLNFLPPPIWGHHHQLDDQQRNPNMNNRDHLVGQLTRRPKNCMSIVRVQRQEDFEIPVNSKGNQHIVWGSQGECLQKLRGESVKLLISKIPHWTFYKILPFFS